MPQRRDYIDELKGLGILLVVFGHFMEQYRMGYSFVSASFFCIYAFHMALFCTCSGSPASMSQSLISSFTIKPSERAFSL